MKCFVYKGQTYEYAGTYYGYARGMLNDEFHFVPEKDAMFVILDTTPEKNKEKIQKFQEIVDNKSAQEINNVFVDLFTASCVIQIYNALNDEQKKKLRSLSVQDICTQSLKLARKL